MLGEQVDCVVDGGPSPIGAPSTVVDVSGVEPRILRVGAIEPERLRALLARSG